MDIKKADIPIKETVGVMPVKPDRSEFSNKIEPTNITTSTIEVLKGLDMNKDLKIGKSYYDSVTGKFNLDNIPGLSDKIKLDNIPKNPELARSTSSNQSSLSSKLLESYLNEKDKHKKVLADGMDFDKLFEPLTKTDIQEKKSFLSKLKI